MSGKNEITIWANIEYLFINKKNGRFTIMKLKHIGRGEFANFVKTEDMSWTRVSINQFNKRNLEYIGEIQDLDEELK